MEYCFWSRFFCATRYTLVVYGKNCLGDVAKVFNSENSISKIVRTLLRTQCTAHALQVGGSQIRKYLRRKKRKMFFGIINLCNIAQTIFSIEYWYRSWSTKNPGSKKSFHLGDQFTQRRRHRSKNEKNSCGLFRNFEIFNFHWLFSKKKIRKDFRKKISKIQHFRDFFRDFFLEKNLRTSKLAGACRPDGGLL